MGTQDWGSPYTTLKQTNKQSSIQRRVSELGLNTVATVAGQDRSASAGGGGGAVRAAMWASSSVRASEGDGFCFAVWRECLLSSMDLRRLRAAVMSFGRKKEPTPQYTTFVCLLRADLRRA